MEDLRTLVDALGHWADRLMPDPDRARRLRHDLDELVHAEKLDLAAPLTGELVATVEATCHRTARHLTLEQHDRPGVPDTEPPGWPAVPRADVAARAGYVRSVRRGGQAGELRLDGFDELSHAAPYLLSAFTVLSGCDAVVLDLRSNGGGAMSSMALVAEFVLGSEPTHLATVHSRVKPLRQWWTPGWISGATALAADARVAVLIGPGTYSSGEALAYHLQNRGVRTFGSRTPGAADHVTPVRVTPSVTALMPEGTPVDPVTGRNWEGRGVHPEVECDPDDAATVARDWLR